jgi:hypothetical protein
VNIGSARISTLKKEPPKILTYESNSKELLVPQAEEPVSTITAGF